jgi:cardiolipin synthase (CMP-forming)
MSLYSHPSLWATVPNGLSLIRVLLAPPLIIALASGKAVCAVTLMAIAIASDIADGWLARLTGTATKLGAFLDPLADVALVLSIQLMLVLSGDWPHYLPALSLASVLMFVLLSLRCGHVTRTRLGKRVGAVLMFVIFVALTCRSISPFLWDAMAVYACPLAATYIAAALLENLRSFILLGGSRAH